MRPPVGFVISGWRVTQRASDGHGAYIYSLCCLGCGRSFNANEAQVSNLTLCACSRPSEVEEAPTRLHVNLARGFYSQ